MAIKIVECHSVSPSDGAAEQSLPLLHFDMICLHFRPTETLYFYSFKCSESYFLETIVVKLKHSLSITLKHFLPLVGKIIFPLTSAGMPVCRYASGDSVALTIAVSDADFADLAGYHSRTADEFHQLVSQLPPPVYTDDGDIKFGSVAIQATLFPNQGICIGFTHHHAICDAKGLVGFIRAWASVDKQNSDGHFVGNSLSLYDRSRVQDATKFTAICWAQAATNRPTVSNTDDLPPHLLRATFILSDAQIEKLKNIVMIKKPSVSRVSAFVVVCAHLWSCLAKSGEEAADDEPEYFISPVDCRALLEPPLPDNYFGNCLIGLVADSIHGRLRGRDGFVAAAEAIADAIGNTVKHGRGISEYFENRRWLMIPDHQEWIIMVQIMDGERLSNMNAFILIAMDPDQQIFVRLTWRVSQLSSIKNYTSLATCNGFQIYLRSHISDLFDVHHHVAIRKKAMGDAFRVN